MGLMNNLAKTIKSAGIKTNKKNTNKNSADNFTVSTADTQAKKNGSNGDRASKIFKKMF